MILILNLAKQIIIRGYLLLESLEIIFFLQMAYELLSQNRKLNERGVLMRAGGRLLETRE